MTSMIDHKLRTPILSQTIKDLHCKPDAPYPSQKMTKEQMLQKFRDDIKMFRRAQEKVTLKEVPK
jgi:hypothetical protein